MYSLFHSETDDPILEDNLIGTGHWWRLFLVDIAPSVLSTLSLQSCSLFSCSLVARSLVPRAEHLCMRLHALQPV